MRFSVGNGGGMSQFMCRLDGKVSCGEGLVWC